MGPTDSKRLTSHNACACGHGAMGAGPGHHPHLSESEVSPATYYASDLVDGAHLNWESAWIDLGGEG